MGTQKPNPERGYLTCFRGYPQKQRNPILNMDGYPETKSREGVPNLTSRRYLQKQKNPILKVDGYSETTQDPEGGTQPDNQRVPYLERGYLT